MRPRAQIIAGWAVALSAIVMGTTTLQTVADKAASQRAGTVLNAQADAFRHGPELTATSDTTNRLVELYGPDSLVDTPLRRVEFDLGTVDHDYAPLLSESATVMAEAQCLAEAVYYEARSETRAGQIAVAQVVVNRVRSRHFPNSLCEVVYQGSERSTGCQFSFTCDGSMDTAPKGRSWTRSQSVANLVMSQPTKALVGRSTHYHTTAIKPVWSAELDRTRTVGSHVFYSFPFRERGLGSAVSVAVAPPI